MDRTCGGDVRASLGHRQCGGGADLEFLKEERVEASKILQAPSTKGFSGNRAELTEAVRDALYASKIISYAQGFAQLGAASKLYDWALNFGDIASIWRGGCIIRAHFSTTSLPHTGAALI